MKMFTCWAPPRRGVPRRSGDRGGGAMTGAQSVRRYLRRNEEWWTMAAMAAEWFIIALTIIGLLTAFSWWGE